MTQTFSLIGRYSKPATTTVKNLKAKVDEARENCLFVDCGFWAGVTGENDSELIALANNGVFGFKAILNPQESYPDFPHLTAKTLKTALEILEETNCVFAVSLESLTVMHESSFIFQIKPEIEATEPDVPEGSKAKSYAAYLARKPASIEKLGVQLVIDAVKQHKMRIHLTDVSSAECLSLMQRYQGAATPKMSKLSFETSLHYLALMSEDIAKWENGVQMHTSDPEQQQPQFAVGSNEKLRSVQCFEQSHAEFHQIEMFDWWQEPRQLFRSHKWHRFTPIWPASVLDKLPAV